jgi:hypothetical protein
MTKSTKQHSALYPCPADIQVYLGSVLLPTKKAQLLYEWLFESFAKLFKPCDVIEWLCVKDLAYNRSERAWLNDTNAALVQRPRKNYICERSHSLYLAGDAESNKLCQRRAAELAGKIKELKGAPDHIKAETERLQAESKRDLEIEIDKTVRETYNKVKEMKLVIDNDASDVDSLPTWYGSYVQVSERIAVLDKEYTKLLDDYDQYRHGGFHERLRNPAKEIIEGEYEEELDPPVVDEAKAKQTPRAPAASTGANSAVNAQLSPEGSQVHSTLSSDAGDPD